MIPTKDLFGLMAGSVKYYVGKLFNTKSYQKFEEEKWTRVRAEYESRWGTK